MHAAPLNGAVTSQRVNRKAVGPWIGSYAQGLNASALLPDVFLSDHKLAMLFRIISIVCLPFKIERLSFDVAQTTLSRGQQELAAPTPKGLSRGLPESARHNNRNPEHKYLPATHTLLRLAG
jgi:hypothetical protein